MKGFYHFTLIHWIGDNFIIANTFLYLDGEDEKDVPALGVGAVEFGLVVERGAPHTLRLKHRDMFSITGFQIRLFWSDPVYKTWLDPVRTSKSNISLKFNFSCSIY